LNFTFKVSQDSAAANLRCCGQCGTRFVANFLGNTRVKEFGKLANIYQSYERMYSGTVVLTRCV